METLDGPVPIAMLEEDTYVLAYNEETNENGYYPILKVWAHVDSSIVYLTIDSEMIVTTPEHPFFTHLYGWVEAGNLVFGDQILKSDGSYGQVRQVELVSQSQPMYNLTVAEAHTFFVGGNEWLVHNICGKAKEAGLPTSGRIRYVPPRWWRPWMDLPQDKATHGYIDRFENVWVLDKGKSWIEWDVQLSNKGWNKIGWLSRSGSHVNVSGAGEVTH